MLAGQDNFAIPGTLGQINGDNVQVLEAANYPSGYFMGGMIRAPDGSLRFVIHHVGDVLTLSRKHEGLVEDSQVTLYPGCDRTKETCISKFNNLSNFGGFPYIPVKNPFGGSSIA